MKFRSKDGPIPIDNFGNDIKPKADPNASYSPEFVEANKRKLDELKAAQKKRMEPR